MGTSTECLKYCKKLDNKTLIDLQNDLEHMTENKNIYAVLPELRTLKHYVLKELFVRGLEPLKKVQKGDMLIISKVIK